MCKSKQNLIQNIYFHLNQYGEFILWDVDIYDDDDMKGEAHKASRIFINSDNIAMVELDNGDEIDIEELSYNELLCIYEGIV